MTDWSTLHLITRLTTLTLERTHLLRCLQQSPLSQTVWTSPIYCRILRTPGSTRDKSVPPSEAVCQGDYELTLYLVSGWSPLRLQLARLSWEWTTSFTESRGGTDTEEETGEAFSSNLKSSRRWSGQGKLTRFKLRLPSHINQMLVNGAGLYWKIIVQTSQRMILFCNGLKFY